MKINDIELKHDPAQQKVSSRAERSNGTDFCLRVSDFALSGQVNSSEAWIRQLYLQYLDRWLNEVNEKLQILGEMNNDPRQIQLISNDKTQLRRRPILSMLERVWRRDGWRCVYCGKYLLHPALVKQAISAAPNDWISRLSRDNTLSKTHLLREHQATYDHVIPFSKAPEFDNNEDNLATCCRECNQEKKDSTDYTRWKRNKYLPWMHGTEQQLGQLIFSGGDSDAEFYTRPDL